MVLFCIVHLFLYLMLVLFLQLQTKTVLFRFFQYSLDVNLKSLLILIIVLNYNRFSFLIFLNNISILIYFHLSLVCPIFYITYFLSTMVEKCHFLIWKWKRSHKGLPFYFWVNSISLILQLYYSIFYWKCLLKFVECQKMYFYVK